jgi:peptide/nickel transport system permease protein
MRGYLLRRLLLLLPTLIGITLITFVVLNLVPGDPIEVLAGGDSVHSADPEILEKYRHDLGFDRPAPVRYLHWLSRVARFDFGRSFRDHRDVWLVIRERLPHTLVLNASALGLMFLLALPLGWLSALWRGGWVDRIAAAGLYLLYCLPNFAIALLLQILLASRWGLLPLQGMESSFAADLGLFPRLWDRFLHLLLPAICLSLGGLAYLTRFARAGLLESIRKDYVTVARAKGLSRRAAVLKHALRNSMIPLLTLTGMMIPALLGGSVIIERIFSWPGIGRLFFTAIGGRDYPVIMGLTTLSALLSLAGLLASDLLYAWADPRVTFRGRSRT